MKIIRITGKIILLTCLIILFTLLSFGLYRTIQQRSVKKDSMRFCMEGIDSHEKIKINNFDHSLLIRGASLDLPILLFVHGGPGTPEMALSRYYENHLLNDFLIVHYDQRGAGKSYASEVPISIDIFVEDLVLMVEYLKIRFKKDKIFLLGHSWGTLISLRAVAQRPDLFHSYFGVSQIIDMNQAERVSYNYTLKKATESQNEEALAELSQLGDPPFSQMEKVMIQRKWLKYFHGADYDSTIRGKLPQKVLFSPDYSIKELINTYKASKTQSRELWSEMLKVNFFEEINRVEIPVYFFQGRYDYQVPSVIVKSYFDRLEAPTGKSFIWFEKSGHLPNIEESNLFQQTLIDIKNEL